MAEKGGAMWAFAGVLLGLVAVSAFAGFHLGPHVHAASTIFGTISAALLVILAFTGHADALLFGLLAADVVVTGGVGAIAYKGFAARNALDAIPSDTVIGSFATAVDDLDPGGTVRLRGELWSAYALNPPIPAGSSVHVVHRNSVRLEVWGDTGAGGEELFSIPEALPAPPPNRSSAQTDETPDTSAGEERTSLP